MTVKKLKMIFDVLLLLNCFLESAESWPFSKQVDCIFHSDSEKSAK